MKSEIERLKKLRWIYLVVAIVLFLFLGMSYGWSIFRGPLEEDFGWSKSQTSLAFTIQIVMFCTGGLISGVITRAKGPKLTMLISAVSIGVGFFCVSRIDTLIGLYISYSILFGTGCGLCYNAVLSTVVRWFPEKQGMVSGIVLFGYGSGAMILGTIAAKIITMFGWRFVFLLFAIVFPILIIICSIIIKPPTEKFLDEMDSGASGKLIPSVEELEPKDMIKRPNFWIYEIWAVVFAAAGFAVINESTPFATEVLGDNLTRAAAIAGIVSVFNGVGRVISGILFDKLGYRKTMFGIVFLYALSAAALIGTFHSHSVTLLIASYVLIGTSYGGAVPINSAFAAYFFGRKNYGINYSIINLNPIAGAILGPMLGGGDFLRTFYMIAVFTGIGFIANIFIRVKK